MKKGYMRLFAALLSVLLLVGTIPLNIFALEGDNVAEVWVNGEMKDSSENSFEEMWNKAVSLASKKTDKEEKAEVVFKIYSDWNADSKGFFGNGTGFKNGAISVPSDKIITIDLNGFMIDRGLTEKTAATRNGMVIYMESGSELTVIDSGADRVNKGSVTDGVWYDDVNGTTEIKGGVITGGHNLTDGGAFYLEDKTSLVLSGGTIAGNMANDGGGVQIEGSTSKLQMSENTAIMYNRAKGEIYGGGGICTDGTSITIAGGNVKNNTAKYGGGIYCYKDDVSIIGVNIENNTATVDGGGIYPQEPGVSVSSSTIKGNSAKGNGGGIFVYNTGTSVSDSVIENNSAVGKGDGVFVSEDCDISVSGKMLIKNNGEENLYLAGNNELLPGSMSRGTEIYVSLAGAMDSLTGSANPFVSAPADTRPEYFFSDKDGYYIARQNNPSESNYRYLYFEKGTRPETDAKVLTSSSVNTAYGTYEGDNGTYGLYKGHFEYASVLDTVNNYAPTFYYSDGYFDSDPKKYNSHLATMSLSLAMSAFVKNTENEEKYFNQFAHVKQLMSDIGCADEDIYVNDDYLNKPAFFGKDAERLSTIGVAIANKKIKIADTEYTLIPVAVRGAGYEIEWASNGTLGASGESQGFSDAATQAFNLIEKYISDYGLQEAVQNGTAKFWLVGYSRASVTANIAAKRLVDKYGQNNDIYGYCFEVPQGGSDEAALKEEWTDNGLYYSIHNIINKADFVTMLMPTEMGLKRYGVDHFVPGNPEVFEAPESETNTYNGGDVTISYDNSYDGYEVSHDTSSLYFKQRELMLKQLQAVNPDLQFEDYFHKATINYVGYVVGTKDLIGEVTDDGLTPDEFVLDFYGKLMEWALCNDEVKNYREYFATYKPWSADSWGADKPTDLGYFETEMTVEDAIRTLINLIFGKDSEDSDALIDILLSSALGISAVDFSGNISLLELYLSYIRDWQNRTRTEKVEMGNKLIEAVLKERYPGAETIFDYLTDEEAEEVLEALPVIIDLLLTFVGKDYNAGVLDDSQVMLGTFAYNMNTLISAHYPEINLAWLRSYDSNFAEDKDAFIIEASEAAAPTGTLYSDDGMLTLSAAPGSAIYYSTDDGATWNYYRRALAVDSGVSSVKAYTMQYGIKSAETVINAEKRPENEKPPFVPSISLDGKGIAVMLGGAGVVAAAIAGIVIAVKKRKKVNM